LWPSAFCEGAKVNQVPDVMPMISVAVFLLVILVFFMVPLIRIVTKAGFSGWWVLLYLVPLLNIVMLWVFAFSRWPALKTSKDTAAVF
jgi:hypothetical protein